MAAVLSLGLFAGLAASAAAASATNKGTIFSIATKQGACTERNSRFVSADAAKTAACGCQRRGRVKVSIRTLYRLHCPAFAAGQEN